MGLIIQDTFSNAGNLFARNGELGADWFVRPSTCGTPTATTNLTVAGGEVYYTAFAERLIHYADGGNGPYTDIDIDTDWFFPPSMGSADVFIALRGEAIGLECDRKPDDSFPLGLVAYLSVVPNINEAFIEFGRFNGSYTGGWSGSFADNVAGFTGTVNIKVKVQGSLMQLRLNDNLVLEWTAPAGQGPNLAGLPEGGIGFGWQDSSSPGQIRLLKFEASAPNSPVLNTNMLLMF